MEELRGQRRPVIHPQVEKINSTIDRNVKIKMEILVELSTVVYGASICCKINYRKVAKFPDELSVREMMVYSDIMRFCPRDGDIMNICNSIENCTFSGRTIDTLVTRFTKKHSTCYIVPSKNIFDPCHTVDLEDTYKQKMFQYSKTFFDCFARGTVVVHTLNSGEKIKLVLCQFMFFIWSERFSLIEFLRLHYSEVVLLRQISKRVELEQYIGKDQGTPYMVHAFIVNPIKHRYIAAGGVFCQLKNPL